MMRSKLLLRVTTIVFMFLVPFAATADYIPNGLKKSICQAGTQTKTSESFISESGGREAFEKLVGTNNFCTNEKVTLVFGFGFYMEDEIRCICTNQREFDSVGCESGKTQPTVTTIIDKSTSGCASEDIVLSKCVRNPEAEYKAACKSGRSMAIVPPAIAAFSPAIAPLFSALRATPTFAPGEAFGQPTLFAATVPQHDDVDFTSMNVQSLLESDPVSPEGASFSLAQRSVAPPVTVRPETFGRFENADTIEVGREYERGTFGDRSTLSRNISLPPIAYVYNNQYSNDSDFFSRLLNGSGLGDGSGFLSSLRDIIESFISS